MHGNHYFKISIFLESLNLEVISPKMFEAIMLGTVLVMYEGNYSNIFLSNIHYISLKRDHSNIEEVILKIKDDEYLQNMANRTYKDIVESGKYSYKTFINSVGNILDDNII